MPGLLLSDDLLDASRIAGSARAVGMEVRAVGSIAQLHEMVGKEPPSFVLIDLHVRELDLPGLLGWLGEHCRQVPRVLAYGSHVDAARLRAAREAGCDLVLPRSAFFEQLERDLPDWLNESGSTQAV